MKVSSQSDALAQNNVQVAAQGWQKVEAIHFFVHFVYCLQNHVESALLSRFGWDRGRVLVGRGRGGVTRRGHFGLWVHLWGNLFLLGDFLGHGV